MLKCKDCGHEDELKNFNDPHAPTLVPASRCPECGGSNIGMIANEPTLGF